jgi:hypothetical protein
MCSGHLTRLRKPNLEILRRKWEANIKMNHSALAYESLRWIELAQDHVQWQALVLAVWNLGVLLPDRELIS